MLGVGLSVALESALTKLACVCSALDERLDCIFKMTGQKVQSLSPVGAGSFDIVFRCLSHPLRAHRELTTNDIHLKCKYML